MENKNTSELLDLLWKYERESEKTGDALPDEYDDVVAELRKRPPFDRIVGNRQDEGYEPSIEEKPEEALDDVKRLKRHKHDERSGDVMIRI